MLRSWTGSILPRNGVSIEPRAIQVGRIALVGFGGTGSYILDLVAKTPVREIHLFDGDRLLQHNAFRAPGAPSVEELRAQPFKVDHYTAIYSRMRMGLVSHPYFIDAARVCELDTFDFVFLAFDGGSCKRQVIERLEQMGRPFIDVGMGLYEVDAALSGQLRVVTSTPTSREVARSRIPIIDESDANDYDRNIQIADLNALNATLAVIRWKKLCGFYLDLERETF